MFRYTIRINNNFMNGKAFAILTSNSNFGLSDAKLQPVF